MLSAPAGARGSRKKLTAVLDAQAGAQYEGETPAEPTALSLLAINAWNHLGNGMGGLDWAGLDTVAALFDPTDKDFELMLHLFVVIKRHKPPEGARG